MLRVSQKTISTGVLHDISISELIWDLKYLLCIHLPSRREGIMGVAASGLEGRSLRRATAQAVPSALPHSDVPRVLRYTVNEGQKEVSNCQGFGVSGECLLHIEGNGKKIGGVLRCPRMLDWISIQLGLSCVVCVRNSHGSVPSPGDLGDSGMQDEWKRPRCFSV